MHHSPSPSKVSSCPHLPPCPPLYLSPTFNFIFSVKLETTHSSIFHLPKLCLHLYFSAYILLYFFSCGVYTLRNFLWQSDSNQRGGGRGEWEERGEGFSGITIKGSWTKPRVGGIREGRWEWVGGAVGDKCRRLYLNNNKIIFLKKKSPRIACGHCRDNYTFNMPCWTGC